ncbi:hypothetical protein [Acinetobacter silvestris]|uniref:HD domain-containing protein n=1 Tax=Acinetobacter silvestris TaxID=1977882 RepID=A0A1Y3CPW3_9GAMM|nr:hypothetical protein [Acinetobacter silvestris]OTG67656.1 hypothetical protein B9T28_03300 [Acinetobacter silvestris]
MIGSREWMNSSHGSLTIKEKIKLINKVFIPASLAFSKTFFPQTPSDTSLELSEFIIPDTTIVKDAILELDNCGSPSIIHHSWRSYFWGAAIAKCKTWHIDHESLLIASLIHDLALVDDNLNRQQQCKCFTYASALHAEALCKKHNYPQDKTENISNAICLHMNGYLDESDPNLSKEVLILQKATACDVIGTDLALLRTRYRNEVLTKYPREDFNAEMQKLIKKEAQHNPKSRTALMYSSGLSMMIQMNVFKE